MVRKVLYERLLKLGSKIKEPIKLDIEKELLEAILFDKQENGGKKFAHRFDEEFEHPFDKIIYKIDLTDVSFDGVYVGSIDFTGSKGVKINPQTIKNKVLFGTKLSGVEIIGPFDGVDIRTTDFTGSRGAKINPQTIKNKTLVETKLSDVEIIGPFDGVDIRTTDFTGSRGAKINPQTVKSKRLCGTELCDTEIIGSFAGVDITGTDFTGSKGAKLDPQTVKNRNLDGTTLRDVKIEGSFDGINTSNTNIYDAQIYNMEVKSVIDNILNSLAKVEEVEHQSKDNSAVQKIKK